MEITDGRPGSGHDVEVMMTRMYLDDLISKDEICRSRALPPFLDANSVEHVAIDVCTGQGEQKHSKDRFALSVIEKAATTIP